MRRPLIVTTCLLAVTTTVAACGSSAKSTAPKPAKATTTSAPNALTTTELAALYQQAGPYPVGVTTKTLPLGNKVEIWYPAVKGTTGSETYDVRDFTSPAVKQLLTANIAATITYDAKRDAAVADGKFPVVFFSHGFSGMRLQSTFLTAHLASWGMVVASADHPSRDLFHILGGAPKQDSVGDIEAALQLLKDQNGAANGPLSGHLDFTHVAAIGHSAGGGTVVGAANRIPEIDGYVSLASGLFRNAGSTSNSAPGTTTTQAIPTKPSLFIGGANDQIAVMDKVTRPAFMIAPKPTRLWVIDKAGHNAFDDFCRVGGGAGIIGVAIASGLGPQLSTGPLQGAKRLGEDGCKKPNAAVTDAYPIINHAVTAWLRNLFGIDATPQGLDSSVANSFKLTVTISEKLG